MSTETMKRYPPTYKVYTDGSTYYALNDRRQIVDENPNFVTLINGLVGDWVHIGVLPDSANNYIVSDDLIFLDLDHFHFNSYGTLEIDDTTSRIILRGCQNDHFYFEKVDLTATGHNTDMILVEGSGVQGTKDCVIEFSELFGKSDRVCTCLHIYGNNDAVTKNLFKGGYMYQASRGLKVESGADYVNGNTFLNIKPWNGITVHVEFIKGSGAIVSNKFISVDTQFTNAVTTHGFKDINGNTNLFLGCHTWDFSAGTTANVAGGISNMIIGGNMRSRNWSDAGTDTFYWDRTGMLVDEPVFKTYTDATRGAAGVAGRVIYNSDDVGLNIDDGANWRDTDGNIT